MIDSGLLAPGVRRNVVIASFVSTFAMFAIWGLFSWVPSMLAQPVAVGGAGLGNRSNLFIIVMNLGSFCGYLCFGILADKFSRKSVYLTFLLTAAVAVILYASTHNPTVLFLAGPVWFFGLMWLFHLDWDSTRRLTQVNWGMNFVWKLLLTLLLL